MLVIAHRGASGYHKENTLKAFKAAYEMGSRYFETDVQLSAEGRLILHHDYHFKDFNGMQRPVNGTMATMLSAHGFPFLEELFGVLGADAKINFEIKNDDDVYPLIEQKLLKTLADLDIDKQRILISSFDYPTLKRVREQDEDIKIGVLTRAFDLRQILALKPYSVHMSKERITTDIINTCHANGLKVFIYTVNDAQIARTLQAFGVDGIFSDYPDLLSK